jgi:hypothetical protein
MFDLIGAMIEAIGDALISIGKSITGDKRVTKRQRMPDFGLGPDSYILNHHL